MKQRILQCLLGVSVLSVFSLPGCRTAVPEDEGPISATVRPMPDDAAVGTPGSGAGVPPGGTVAGSGMVTTYSGLRYQILREGNGPRPSSFHRVKVHYHGTLPDGTVFDSSVQRGQPSTFGLNQVIAGWREGLMLMKQGSKYRFIIPPELAYGSRGTGNIGPNQTLIFEVELIEILF